MGRVSIFTAPSAKSWKQRFPTASLKDSTSSQNASMARLGEKPAEATFRNWVSREMREPEKNYCNVTAMYVDIHSSRLFWISQPGLLDSPTLLNCLTVGWAGWHFAICFLVVAWSFRFFKWARISALQYLQYFASVLLFLVQSTILSLDPFPTLSCKIFCISPTLACCTLVVVSGAALKPAPRLCVLGGTHVRDVKLRHNNSNNANNSTTLPRRELGSTALQPHR